MAEYSDGQIRMAANCEEGQDPAWAVQLRMMMMMMMMMMMWLLMSSTPPSKSITLHFIQSEAKAQSKTTT
jgi:hypothetical protein